MNQFIKKTIKPIKPMEAPLKKNLSFITNLLQALPNLELLMLSPVLRASLAIIIIILNLYSYYHNRIRFTKYKNYIFYIMLLLFILDVAFLYLLDIIAPIVSLPKYWWILIMTIAGIFLLSINNNLIQKDDTFNPPPLSLYRKYTRKTILIVLLLLYILSYILEYFINQTYETDIDFRDQKILNYIFKSRPIGILLLIINIYLSFNFHACKYNLPDTWNL